MEKLFTKTPIILATIMTVFTYLFGDVDKLFIALVVFIGLDIATGFLKAIITKTLNSEISYKGFCKKVFIFVLVAVAYWSQGLISIDLPIRNIVICFYIANEGISILENSAEFIPIPEKLKDVLIQLRDKGE